MRKIKILTFLTLTFFSSFVTKADINIEEKNLNLAISKIKITKDGIIASENNSNYWEILFNGLYFSKNLSFDFQPKALAGSRVVDFDTDDNHIFAITYNYTSLGKGIFKVSKDYKNIQNINSKYSFNKILVTNEKIYLGSNTYGLYSMNKDGTNLVQIIGTGIYGPMIDQVKKNNSDIFINARGNFYKINPKTNTFSQIILVNRPSDFEITDKEIFYISYDKFLKTDINGTIKFEKKFNYPLGIIKKYNNYIFITEKNPNETKIWISNNYGTNFYESNLKLSTAYPLTQIEVTGTHDMRIFLKIDGKGVYQGKFNFDFGTKPFLLLPFSSTNSKDLTNKVTSVFDHRFPLLGNHEEPIDFKTTTMNHLGQELPQPYIYYSSHDGVDFGLPINHSILAAEAGTVTYFYQSIGLGHALEISHPNGYITLYGHLSDKNLITKSRTYVNKGQKIGEVGMSGNTNGPHLHFTVYRGARLLENKVDPFGWSGNFEDPWSNYSSHLWEIGVKKSEQMYDPKVNPLFTLGKADIIFNNTSETPLIISTEEIAPIFDRKNYKYIDETSYRMETKDLLNEKVIQFGEIRFKGFTNPQDEKKFSIFKYNGEKLIKLETLFNQETNTLSAKTDLNGHYMILENGYKKLTAKGRFKSTE